MGTKRVNWSKAFKFYCDSQNGRLPSYQDVADEFNVSKKQVGVVAKKEGWIKSRRKLYEKGKEKFMDNKTELLAGAQDRQLLIWREVQEVILAAVEDTNNSKPQELKRLVRALQTAIEGERLVLGLPTKIKASDVKIEQTKNQELPPELIEKMDKFFESDKN